MHEILLKISNVYVRYTIIILVVLNFIPHFGSGNFTLVTLQKRSPRQLTFNCESELEFTCASGSCIDIFLLCDGIVDCPDGSDETYAECKNMPCPTFSFRCKYGACIDLTLRCNGVVNCVDHSDETLRLCGKPSAANLSTTTASTVTLETVTKRPVKPTPAFLPNSLSTTTTTEADEHLSSSSDFCVIPASSADKSYTTVKCGLDASDLSCKKNPGELVPQYTVLYFDCHSGYLLEDGTSNVSYCFNGVWQPTISNCTKICKKLNPQNVKLNCTRNGKEVNCDGDLYPGTEVTAICSHRHKIESTYYYPTVKCNESGKWDHNLLSCVPACGLPYVNVTTLIIGGQIAEFGSAPWHVAVYEVHNHSLVCGGTIITTRLILSAAHCFYDKATRKSIEAANFEIAVSKVSRNYSRIDNQFQKMYKVSEIHFPNQGYHGLLNFYLADIALLATTSEMILTPSVLPACMEWTHNKQEQITDGVLGNVAGWGVTGGFENATESEVLLNTNIPFISKANCLKVVQEDFRRYITMDKFCAGTLTGAGVSSGDSGSGLLFKNKQTSLHYIRGIASVKDSSNSSIAVFTDIREYISWILEVRNEIDSRNN